MIILLSALAGHAVVAADPAIYWTDKDAMKIQRLRPDGGAVEDLLTSAGGLSDPRGFAIDPVRGKMYWADNGTDTIHRANLDGSAVEDVVSDLQFPADIALDRIGRKLYWADRDANMIQRTDLDGAGVVEDVLTGLSQPYYIVLDLVARRIYWSDFDNSVIHRASLDGPGPVEDFITGLVRVRDIALDRAGGKIYWCDRDSSKIQRANLDGTGIEDLFTSADGLGRPHGLALDVTDGQVYWTDTTAGTVSRGNMDGSGAVEVPASGLTGPWGIALLNVVFVDNDNVAGPCNGESWATAFQTVQDGIDAANALGGGQVRVARGIYTPGPPGASRTVTFELTSGVAVCGGYAGLGEPDPDARDTVAYETILSGDLNGDDEGEWENKDENAYHVVTASRTDATAGLNGVTITGGYANLYEYARERGAGLYVTSGSATVIDCTITRNIAYAGSGGVHGGGGMYNNHSSPTVINCAFIDNNGRYGGGMFNENHSSPTIIGCTFIDHYGVRGGGMTNHFSAVTMRNCTFFDNYGYDGTGGMRNEDSNLTLIGCIFSGNRSDEGTGGMSNFRSTVTLVNCLFSGNHGDEGTGAMSNGFSRLTLVNCVFSGNQGDEGAGAMSNGLSRLTLVNCTFSSNTETDYGAGISIGSSTATLTNCIFWANRDRNGTSETSQIDAYNTTPVLNYCCVQNWTGRWGGVGNHGDDPLFLDADGPDDVVGTLDDNLDLAVGSPCVDAGDNAAVPLWVTTDINGNARFVDDADTADTGSGTPPIVDMGAVEGQNFIVNAWSVYVPEGEMTTSAVSLRSNPITRVVVDVTRQSGDPDLTVQAGTALAFDASDYQTPKIFFLEAAEDDDAMDGCAVFMLRTPALRTAVLKAIEVDNDQPKPISTGGERWMLYE